MSHVIGLTCLKKTWYMYFCTHPQTKTTKGQLSKTQKVWIIDDKSSGFDSHREFLSAPRFNAAAILFSTGRRQRGKNRPAFYNIQATWADEAFKRQKSTRFMLNSNWTWFFRRLRSVLHVKITGTVFPTRFLSCKRISYAQNHPPNTQTPSTEFNLTTSTIVK